MTFAPYLLLNTDDPLLGEEMTVDGTACRVLVVKMVYGPPGSIEGEVSAEQPLPVTGGGGGSGGIIVNRASVVDYSGTITAGNTAQLAVSSSDTNRVYLFFQNTSAGPLWINFGTTAVEGSPSIKLNSNDAFSFENSFIYTGTLSVIGATTGQSFICKTASQASSIVNQGAVTDASGTIGTGNTSQQALAANPIRKYIIVYNPGSDNLYINFGSPADLGSTSIGIVPGGQFVMEGTFICTQAMNINAANSSDPFVIKEG